MDTSAISCFFILPVLADGIVGILSKWISDFGYLGIFSAALVETIFPPIPSEIIFPIVGYLAERNNLGIIHTIGMASMGALGSTVGAIFIYYISLKLGRPAIIKWSNYTLISEAKLKKAEVWFEKYGPIAILIGRMAPGIREIISIPAGLTRMNIFKFTAFTYAGSLAWSVSLSLVGYFLGERWGQVSDESSVIFDIITVALIIGFAVFIGYNYYKEFKKRKAKGKP